MKCRETAKQIVSHVLRGDWVGLFAKIRRRVLRRWRKTVLRSPFLIKYVGVGSSVGNNAKRRTVQALLKPVVFDLGYYLADERMDGFFSVMLDQSVVDTYVTAQFRGAAEGYAKITARPPINTVRGALRKIGLEVPVQDRLHILEIGCGSGSATCALLELCPNSLVVASDVSIEMLLQLKNALIDQGADRNCILLQLNAEEPDFKCESFDLILGSQILHHLFHPEKILRECARILKKEGHAIFFEPFESGYGLLKLLFQKILDDPKANALSPDIRDALNNVARDLAFRMGRDKSDPRFLNIDDKWLFTRSYFEELADGIGFRAHTIYNTQSTKRVFEFRTDHELRLSIGKGLDALPDWAINIIQEYDQRFSEGLTKELLFQGCVILKKQ